jgi:hypothetical protein
MIVRRRCFPFSISGPHANLNHHGHRHPPAALVTAIPPDGAAASTRAEQAIDRSSGPPPRQPIRGRFRAANAEKMMVLALSMQELLWQRRVEWLNLLGLLPCAFRRIGTKDAPDTSI